MKAVFKSLIILWILIAFLNVFYNTTKTFSEIREWGSLSDGQKRHKLFGDLHEFLTLVKNNTDSQDKIMIFANGGEEYRTYFLSMYYLFPRRITSTIDIKEFTKVVGTKRFKFVAIYDSPIESNDYEKIASFSAKDTTNYGSIYKLK